MIQGQWQCTYTDQKKDRNKHKKSQKNWKGNKDGVPRSIKTRIVKIATNVKGHSLIWQSVSLVTKT